MLLIVALLALVALLELVWNKICLFEQWKKWEEFWNYKKVQL